MDGRFEGAGFYRVHVTSSDGDWVTIIVPLDGDAKLDKARPGPHLFKATWVGDEWYGELHVAPQLRFGWSADAPDSSTDLGEHPLGPDTRVRIWESDADSTCYTFRVRSMLKL